MADFQGKRSDSKLFNKLSVLIGSDDGEEENDSTWYPDGESGTIYAGKFSTAPYYAAFRFKQAVIPNNAKIDKATLRLKLKTSVSNPTYLKIRAVSAGSPATFAADGSDRPSTRSLTTAAIDWDFATPPGSGGNSADTWVESPDISSVIEELLALPDYDGSAIVIIVEPDTDCPDDKLAPFYDVSEGDEHASQLLLTLAPRL